MAVVASPAVNRPASPPIPISPLLFSSPGSRRRRRLKPPLLPAATVFPPVSVVRTAAIGSADASRWRIGAVPSGEVFEGRLQGDGMGGPSLDAVLEVTEFLCITPPAICSIVCLVGSVLPGTPKQLQALLGSRVFVLQFALLAGAVVVGAVIRQRQWRRVCRHDGTGVNLIARIEKVEEDLRSSATIVRVLSRQLEKLGIRFRVTRKALKEPISETAALAQKNSEATRALAMQEDILEKELGEIQKVLLAMQEQQQKQLELILAIGKAGRLLESKRDVIEEQGSSGNSNSIPKKKVVNQVEIQTELLGVNNDKA